MKKSNLILLLVIAMATGIFVSLFGNISANVSFEEAKSMAEDGNKSVVQVIGQLKKDEQGNIIGMYHDKVNPDIFSFVMVDDKGVEQRILYKKGMPTDIDKSEKVTVNGKFEEDMFVASKIVLKCPSKYKDKEQLQYE